MHDPLLGQQLDRYRLHALLGHGGMARVYQATDTQLGREVALKVVEPPRVGADAFIARFHREAHTLASMQHPHIVAVYSVGQHGTLTYLVQELLPGPTLDAEIAAARASGTFLDPARLRTVITQVASALDYAHGRGVIHRDLKPSNLMRNAHGAMVLMDFGIAKTSDSVDRLTQTGMVLGTPHYLAPEQAQGLPLSSATDIYALGVMLFEALTNQVPFNDPSSLAIALAHVTQPPPSLLSLRPDLPPAVADVVATALAKVSDQRYPSAGALAAAFDAAWSAAPAVVARPTTTAAPRHQPPPAPPQAMPRQQAATTVNPALAAHAEPARSATPPCPSPPLGAPAPRPAAPWRRRVGGAVGIASVLLLGGWITRSREAPPPPAASLRSIVVAEPESTPPLVLLSTTSVPPAAPDPATPAPGLVPAIPPTLQIPAADPRAQAVAILDWAVASGQADPATAQTLQQQIAALGQTEDSTQRTGKGKGKDKKDKEKDKGHATRGGTNVDAVLTQVTAAEAQGTLGSVPAAEIRAALGRVP